MNSNESPRTLLDAAYTQLEFDRGIFSAAKKPTPEEADEWIEKGDWRALAEDVGAERIFFVDREPVAVFAELNSSDPTAFRTAYNRIWCMARPQLLFLARPGELSIYDLTQPPMRLNDTPDQCSQLLDKARTLADVQKLRVKYHRELLETGAVFGDARFGKELNRADHALIRDLKEVRRALDELKIREGVDLSAERKCQLIHSLIGRAIFIRYLEDREIITRAYFDKVVELHADGAAQRKDWRRVLDQPSSRPDVTPAMEKLLFPRVLNDKGFTYALFEQLAHDFNGDTFPVEPDERRALLQGHLTTLRDFLLGVRTGEQELFFYAYDFNIIPIELISSIYEEFYNERVGDESNQGAHYTPPALVEFVLAHTLTPDVLASKPRVLDPACGSGIFLVEAFRRMVRKLCAEKGVERPSRTELRTILREQIAGMDINEEAVRVAAFSLYLAFLHYQKPREILPDPGENLSAKPERLRAVRLPHLKYVPSAEKAERERARPGAEFFDTLLAASAFDPVMGKCEPAANASFGDKCANVVVGNPPWGDPKPKTERERETVARLKEWCDAEKSRPVGDNERSQAFIHLASALLKEGGRAGLLISSGVFFKHHENSKAFRKVWLKAVQLRQVVNFAHVRRVFFSGPSRKAKAISPFASIVFEKISLSRAPDNEFEYWSAKRSAVVEKAQAIVMTRGDMHRVRQRDCLENEQIWKIYWWGGHQDEALVKFLETFPKLAQLNETILGSQVRPGQGFKEGNKSFDAEWLAKYRELRIPSFQSYGSLSARCLIAVPDKVERRGVEEVYSGRRLLVRQGIIAPGLITARFETRRCCFRNSIEAVRLDGFEEWQEQTILGIFWSSLARYYFFATAGSWGLWHDQLHLENIGRMPICFPKDQNLRRKLVRVVSELQNIEAPKPAKRAGRKVRQTFQTELALSQTGPEARRQVSASRIVELERELDEIVFAIYGLSATERDLVLEMCSVGLDLFYHAEESAALQPVRVPLAGVAPTENEFSSYVRVFSDWWNEELAPEGKLIWRNISPPSGAPLLAVVFETSFGGNVTHSFSPDVNEAWHEILEKLARHAHVPAGSSKVFTDTFFRVVTDRQILIVKRNEQRFWTKSAARGDAEATSLQAMRLQAEMATA